MFASADQLERGRSATIEARERFAANLRRTRLQKGLSQEDLGASCELHRTEISLLERNQREPRLGTIIRLAQCLGVTPEDLLRGLD